MKKIIFALIFNVIFINNSFAQQNLQNYIDECYSIIENPKVKLTSSYGNLRYDFSKDADFLLRETIIKHKQVNMELPEGQKPIGLTKIKDKLDVQIEVGVIGVSDGYTCLFPKSIKAHLGYLIPTIYIQNDLHKDSCFYNVALKHEKTHMQIYIEALDYYLPKFKQKLEKVFDELKIDIITPEENVGDSAKIYNNKYVEYLQKDVDEWRKQVEVEQMKLDSIENYMLENKICKEIDGIEDK